MEKTAHGCGHFVVSVSAGTDADPERDEQANDADQAESETACFQSYSPQGPHKRVDGEDLIRCESVGLGCKKKR